MNQPDLPIDQILHGDCVEILNRLPEQSVDLIFADVAPDARLSQEEVFGPVLTFVKADDFEQAMAIANNTEYGLTGGLFSQDEGRLARAGQDFHVGNLYLNRKITGAMVGAHPFGGFNMSGTDSKAGGPDYLLLFMQAKLSSAKIGATASRKVEGTSA